MYRTDDYGQTWTRLETTGLEAGHFVRVIREDPEREGLLFAGTENGLYVSFNGGDNWQSLQRNLPITPITDLLIHQGDLVVATQGRSFWILDDLSPLREITTQTIAADMHLYSPKNAIRSQGVSPSGSAVYFALAEEPEEVLNLEFMDPQGDVVRVYSTEPNSWDVDAKTAIGRPANWSPSQLEAAQGLNRMTWDLREEGPGIIENAVFWGFAGRVPAVPGVYQVRLSMGNLSQTQSLRLLIDPRIAHEVTIEDLQIQHDLMVQVREMLRQSHNIVRDVRSVRTQMTDIAQTAKVAGYGDEFIEMADEAGEKLTGVEEEVFQTKNESGQDPLNFPSMLDGEIANLYGYISSTYDRPNAIAAVRANELAEELEVHLQELQRILDTDVADFNAKLREAGVPGVIVRTPPRATS
jgi:hypothetical protein